MAAESWAAKNFFERNLIWEFEKDENNPGKMLESGPAIN